MKIKILVSILLLQISNSTVYSQKTYYPGYVVLNSGDTLHGSVMDRNIQKGDLYEKIRFKTENTRIKRYSANDIIAYTSNGVLFESKWYYEEFELFKFKYLNQPGIGEKVFLKVIAKGRLSCYIIEYVDPENDYFDGFELFLRDGDDYFQRATQGIFGLKKKRLSEYFTDCPVLVKKINSKVLKTPLEVLNYYNTRCQ